MIILSIGIRTQSLPNCFQEAFLSGYADIFKRNFHQLTPLIREIKQYAYKKNIAVMLPTIEKYKHDFVSSVYVFNTDHGDFKCYKEGLTPSEKTVMKSRKSKRLFSVSGVKRSVLICREMQDPAYRYLNKTNLPDIILWPSYWGWKYHEKWGPLRQSDGKLLESPMVNKKDKCYQLVNKIKRPLIQINMATTFRGNGESERYGKSVVVNAENKKVGVGKFGAEDLFVIDYIQGDIKKSSKISLIS